MKSLRSARQVALIACMAATLFVAKQALSFLPNIEAVTLLLIVYSIAFGRKTVWAVLVFVALECMIWSVHLWTVMYLYTWPALVLLVCALRKIESHIFWCLIAAGYGLFFGMICAIPYVVLGGWHMAVSWWIAGIPYDLLHAAGNFCLCLVLFKPLLRLARKVQPMFD